MSARQSDARPVRRAPPLTRALRARRRALGFSQDAVAARAGFGRAELSRWESGTREPRWSSLVAWVQALDLDLAVVDGPRHDPAHGLLASGAQRRPLPAGLVVDLPAAPDPAALARPVLSG